jgi:hypothetical protein
MATELTAAEKFRAYRALVGRPDDGLVYWWYAGTLIALVDGLPPLPVIQATTLMVYRLETLNERRFAIHWDEVGYFTDFATAEPVGEWLNPLTGQFVTAPRTFVEGPGRYQVTQAAAGLDIQQQQPGARIKSIELDWTLRGSRLTLLQTERKFRGLPQQDGSLPAADSASAFEACTRLSFGGDVEPQSATAEAMRCGGSYDFRLAGLPPWMGLAGFEGSAVVSGVICKTAARPPQFARATQALRRLFPEFMEKFGA